MSIKIGQVLIMDKKEYKVVGTDKRSFILEHNGKQYKATAEKINKIIEQEKHSKLEFPYVEHRIKRMNIFKLDAKMPTNFKECIPFFETLCGELSPENLCCDGEATRGQIIAKQRQISAEWKELEKISGKKVSEGEIEGITVSKYLNKDVSNG